MEDSLTGTHTTDTGGRESVCIEFVGLPGVGKTTLSQTVATELTSRGISVSEPTRQIDTHPDFRRIVKKTHFAARSWLKSPQTDLRTARESLATDQHTVQDLIHTLFNLYYISGVVNANPSCTVCLLDQGPYQGIWSIGLQAKTDWSTIFDRFEGYLTKVSPTMVVFVEASEETIEARIRKRTGGSTRFSLDTETFDRGINGYEKLKSQIRSADSGPNSILVENESREVLQPNAVKIADVIQSGLYDPI